MKVKEAVKLAVGHVVELFEQDHLTNIGLEEVSFDPGEKEWVVTVGFSRPWDYPSQNALAALTSQQPPPRRAFKIVRISDNSGEVVSITNYSGPS